MSGLTTGIVLGALLSDSPPQKPPCRYEMYVSLIGEEILRDNWQRVYAELSRNLNGELGLIAKDGKFYSVNEYLKVCEEKR